MTRTSHPIPGGLHPAEHKSESNGSAIAALPLLERYVVPLRQHLGAPAKPIVKVGDRVLRGQMIGVPDATISAAVHAPTSGTVTAIEARPVAHPSGLPDLCVEIAADGLDEAVEMAPIAWRDLAPGELAERLADMGLAGLGGAVFPSHIKLARIATEVHTLILNGAECEPWITCDDRLMRERAADMLKGAEIMRHALGAKHIILGIEDNKAEAAAAVARAAAGLGLMVEVAVVPTRYPSGGAKQLLQLITGLETPAGGRPTDLGYQVFNVATAYSLYRAVELGEPMISRVVTVTGHVARPGNFEVRLGTPVAELLEQAGGALDGATGEIVGGPMMGFDLDDRAAPVAKAVNCIIVKHPDLFPNRPPALPCIRCGQCTLACPVSLQPFEMYLQARAKNLDKAQAYNLLDCIECGCCSHVCPSHIPLVDYYRFAKSEVWARDRDKRAAETARERHEFQAFRQEREKQEKAERLGKKAAVKLDNGAVAADDPEAARKKALLEAAVERAKQAKAAVAPKNTEELTAEQQRQVDEIEARRAKSTGQSEVAPSPL
ncbi:MAG: electron transport complex subunit RsxC, partial [Thiobacillus sp.]|nr:electron transport complex subunit RsxC [Thiobacillus sp.]